MGSICSMQIRRKHFKNSQALVRVADGNSAVKFQTNFLKFVPIFVQFLFKMIKRSIFA